MARAEDETIEHWIADASARIERAKTYGAGGNNLRCEDAQQTAELALKALILAHNTTPRRTHDVGTLLEQIETCEKEVPEDVRSAGELTQFGGKDRYEMTAGREPAPSDAETRDAIRKAGRTLEWSRERIRKQRPEITFAGAKPTAK